MGPSTRVSQDTGRDPTPRVDVLVWCGTRAPLQAWVRLIRRPLSLLLPVHTALGHVREREEHANTGAALTGSRLAHGRRHVHGLPLKCMYVLTRPALSQLHSRCGSMGSLCTHRHTDTLPAGPVHTLTLLMGPVHTHAHACWGCSASNRHTRACTSLPGPQGAPTDRQLRQQGVGGGQPRAGLPGIRVWGSQSCTARPGSAKRPATTLGSLKCC